MKVYFALPDTATLKVCVINTTLPFECLQNRAKEKMGFSPRLSYVDSNGEVCAHAQWAEADYCVAFIFRQSSVGCSCSSVHLH